MAPIEELLESWADRVKDRRIGPQGYPTQSWSRAAVAGLGGPDDGKRTAMGKETRSARPPDDHEDWGLDAKIEEGVLRLKRVLPVIWAAGVGYYLGEVPMGYRAAHKMRRRRFTLDDSKGLLVLKRENLTRLGEETESQWKARIARRLTMTPRSFELRLVRFRDCMALWMAEETCASTK